MKTNTKNSTTVFSRWTRILGAMLTVALMVSSVAMSQSPAPVNLGTAGDFAILAKSGISSTGATHITCDIGVSPIAATGITGFGLSLDVSGRFSTSSLVDGRAYAADYNSPTPAKMTLAVGDMEAAYTNAAGRIPNQTDLGAGDITGMTLVTGVYKWNTGLLISAGGVTLSGTASDVWIFQIAGGLTVASGASINLTGGAQACNIFWQVASGATIGTTADMKGNILCQTLIAMNTGATLAGRALAQTAVTLIANTVNSCCNTTLNCVPSCELTAIIPGPPKRLEITVQGPQCGLASIVVTRAVNVTVNIPPFSFGSRNPVVVTATKINQSRSATVELRVTDLNGNSVVCDPVFTTLSAEVPQEFALGANYPNPFNPTTSISFGISRSFAGGVVTLKVFDLLGREIKTLISEPMDPGQYSVQWDATNNNGESVQSGVYIYRLIAGEFSATKKMILLK